MLTRKMARFSAVALVGFACVFATEARADGYGESPVPLPVLALTAPLSCTVPFGVGEGGEQTLMVETVPGGDSSTFPHDVPCPSPATGTCSEFNYKFTSSNGIPLSKSFLSISSDVVIYEASPSGSILINDCIADLTPTNGLAACAQREARFISYASTLNAKVVVSRAVPRVSTAGAVSGYYSAFCLIQGPGVPANPFTPLTTTSNQKAAGGLCNVTVTNGADNRPIKIETSTEDCAVAPQVNVFVNEKPFRDNAGQPFTYGNGTTTCYPTTPLPTCVCRNPKNPCPN